MSSAPSEDIFAKFEEWRNCGVRFRHPPSMQSWGGMSASFEDVDGNSFALVSYESATREIEAQRRAQSARFESERQAALRSWKLQERREVQARLLVISDISGKGTAAADNAYATLIFAEYDDTERRLRLQSIVDEVQRFGSQEQRDDITLIIAKCR